MGLAKIKREQEERKKQEEEAKKKAAEKKEAENKASEKPPKKGASELADKGKKEEPKPSTPTSDVLRDSYNPPRATPTPVSDRLRDSYNPPRTTPTPVSDRLRDSYDPPQYYEPPPSVSDRTRGNTSPPAPSPWAKPDLSFYEPPAPQQVSRDRTDTSTPSVGYSGPQQTTVTLQPPSYNVLTRERQERRQPSSWSQPDILRDPYNAPNRPMVPTQAQGPAANNQNEQEARMQQARVESFLRGYAPPSEPSAPPDVPPTSWGGATPDRLRGEQYNAPNRPMVPTSPDWGNPVPPFASPLTGPANAPGGTWVGPQNQFQLTPEQQALRDQIYGTSNTPTITKDWRDMTPAERQVWAELGANSSAQPLPQQPPSTSWGGVTPDVLSGQYNMPNRPIIPVPPRPAGTDPSILNPKQDVLDAWERYKHTPEFVYAQAAAADRADYDAPPFWQGITEGAEQGRAVTGDSGTAVGGVLATLGGIVGLANQFGPTRAIVEHGQNVLQHVFEVPTMAALNAPLRVSPTGKQFPSISQIVTAGFQEIFSPAAANNRGYLGRIEQGQQARAAVEQAVAETGGIRLALALRNISGANPLENVTATLNLLLYQEEYARQLEQEAATLAASDPVQAGELLLQAHELRSMTVADIVESRMDWRSELGYGLFDIAGEGIGALTAALRFLPEAKALSKAGKALNVTDDVALARLGVVGEAGKKLTQAVAEGPKAAKGEWDNIIAPFQNAGEKFINSKYLQWALTGKPTGDAQIALDAKEVAQTIFAMVGGITNKNDVKIILDNAANKPENLVRGVVGLSAETLGKFMENPPPNAGLRYHPGLVANDDIARRLALLNTVATEIPNMGSLNGPGKLNPIAFQAEMHELIVSAASRVHGGKQPGLPFGAAKVEMEITGNNAARVVYRDSKGKIIQAGAETTLVGAKQQLTDIQRGQNPPPNLLNAPYRFAKVFADIQKYIMNDVWLFDRPANTAGNALGAAVMTYAHDAYTLTPNSKIQEYFVRVAGGYMPSPRAYQTLPGVKDQARTMRDEIGGSAIGWIAAKVTGKGDNPVTQTTRALQDIPYGTTQIPLGNGIAVPVGEEAFSLRANYVPYQRVRNGAILESVNGTFAPAIAADQTIAPEMVNTIRDKLISIAEQNGKADILNEMRGWLGKQEIRGTLKQLGIPAELLLPDEARAIERVIADADIHQAAEVAQEISKVFAGARNRMGSVLHIDPGQPSVHWTDADMANEVGWLSDLMTEDGVKAGLDQATARAQSTELVTTYLEQQQQGIARVLGDFEPVATKPGAVGVVMDFYIDFMREKGTARQAVDEASRAARSLNTPAAWQTKWETNVRIYNGLRGELDTLVENTRVSLQKIFNGDEYTPQYDWWETTRNYLNWDEQAFLTSRANPPIGRTAEADAAFQGYLDLNRQHVDNAQYELLGAFQAYPTMESFDIVRTAFRHTEALGAEAAFRAAELRNARRTGAISAEQYDRQINALWTKHFDDVALLNQTSGKIIVRHGLEKEVASELRWVDNGQTWRLLEPSKNKNKWMARNEQTGKVEEFTVGELGEGASPFTVPKNVVDDFNRLGGDAGLDKAADALMQEIVDSAPAPQPTRTVDPSTGEIPDAPRPMPDVVNEGIVPPRTNVQTIATEPDVAPRMPGYDDPAAVAAEPRFEQGNVSTYDQAASELTPRPAPVEPPVIDDPARRAQYTEIPTETPRRYSIPTDDEIRQAASEAGIATSTEKGRPTDRHLVNSLNKRLNTKHTRLSQFTESERAAAIDALAARAEEQVSRMSPAEAAKATQQAPKPPATTPDEPNMVAYDFAVPNISHMLGTRNNEDAYNLWRGILGKRNNGNNRPPSTAEVAQVTINNLNDAERVLKSKLSEILVGEPNTLSNSQKIKILDEVANWVNKNMDGIDFKARRVGTAMADHVMLNAENRRDFDTLLSLMVPYHYFWSRMPSRLWSAALQKPSLVNWFYETDRAINLENEQAGVPQRLEGTIGIPGTDKRINVARPLLHYAMGGAANYVTQNPYVEDDPTDNQVERWMKWLERNGFPGFNLYLKVAADMLDGKLDKDYSSVLNQLVPIPFVGAPVSSAQQRMTGQMPSKDGVMASVGFGPDVTPDGFALDVYRARRMVTWIAQEEGIDPTIAGFASQVIVNQYEGNDPGFAIPAQYLEEATALAERSVKRAADERIMGRSSSYLTTMGVQSWTEAEQEMQRANQRYWVSGYNPPTGTGSQQLQRDQLDADPSAPRSWTKGSETPGVDAQVSILYDQRAKLQEEKKAAEDAAVAALNMGTATRGEIYDARGQAGAPFKEQIDAIDAQIDELKEQQVNPVGDLRGKSLGEITQALAPGNERPFAGANPQEVSQNFARGVMYQAIKIPGRPETPGDDATSREWRTYGQELAAYYQQQEDYVVRSLTKAHTSDVLRENRGPVTYTDNQARDLWWHFQHDDELPAERARLEQIDRQQAARNATSDAQFANAKQRIKNGDKLLQTYLDTPDDERADLKETDWRYAAITLATYSPDVYDEMVEKFGKAAVQEYFSAYGKAPEYPGENASEEDLQAYYDASNEYDTTYAHRDEINLWLNGRYSWADQNSSPVLGQYDKGAEYDQAVAIFTDRIFDIEREANEASLAGKWKEWRNANPQDYELLIGYQEWTKAARNEPQSAAQLPTARWGFNPATANASYASESDRSPFKGPPAQPVYNPLAQGTQVPTRSQPMSVSDRLRQPYDAPQKESRLERAGRESGLNRPGQIAGINPPAEAATGKGASSIGRSASSMTAKDWANQNEKFVTGGGAEGWGAHYDALDALGDDFGAKRQYMLDNPEFAAYEAARLKQKYNDDVPWWLEEYGKGGYKGYGRDYRDYGRGGGNAGNQWSRNYDEYEALGDDYDAKRQYMLDHPEFAAYELQRIKAKYGELPWWAKPYTQRSGGSGYGGYSYGGGGGGGGGSRTAPFPEGMPQVAPRFMDQRLWQAPGQGRPWVPYSNPSPDWLRAGDRLRPDMPRRWQRPKF